MWDMGIWLICLFLRIRNNIDINTINMKGTCVLYFLVFWYPDTLVGITYSDRLVGTKLRTKGGVSSMSGTVLWETPRGFLCNFWSRSSLFNTGATYSSRVKCWDSKSLLKHRAQDRGLPDRRNMCGGKILRSVRRSERPMSQDFCTTHAKNAQTVWAWLADIRWI
jgi:hypothetical protein